ncbi:MAG: hypothetical protein J2P20_11910, partial [Pseudonocardia sp.]|nr:hypothetical protein [Pseudonocardia sp.]
CRSSRSYTESASVADPEASVRINGVLGLAISPPHISTHLDTQRVSFEGYSRVVNSTHGRSGERIRALRGKSSCSRQENAFRSK